MSGLSSSDVHDSSFLADASGTFISKGREEDRRSKTVRSTGDAQATALAGASFLAQFCLLGTGRQGNPADTCGGAGARSGSVIKLA